MNYYKRHLGDYAKDTRHLSLAEHGAFCLLLDYYYATEKPIPDDRCERIANAYAESERIAVRAVLREFFIETPEGWTNGKADLVIGEFRAKSLKAKQSANARWERDQCERNANASETHSEGNASHKPLATSHKETKAPVVPKGTSDDAAAIIDAYHSILPACQSVAVLGPKRKRLIGAAVKQARQVCRDQGWPYVADDFWNAYFTECKADPWLRGDKPNPNNPDWKQKLETLIDETRFSAVMDKAIAAMRAGE